MIAVYLAALGFGGTLLVASLVLGGGGHHGGGDAPGGHAGGDAHGHGGGHGGGHGHPLGELNTWMPLGSLRFWTFFLGFGGAVGAALTASDVAAAPVVGATAAVIGWVTGVAAVAVIRSLRGHSIDSTLGDADLVGASGTVVVAIAADGIGKVRLLAKGRSFDLIAAGDHGAALATGARVLVVGRVDDDRVLVAPDPAGADAVTDADAS